MNLNKPTMAQPYGTRGAKKLNAGAGEAFQAGSPAFAFGASPFAKASTFAKPTVNRMAD